MFTLQDSFRMKRLERYIDETEEESLDPDMVKEYMEIVDRFEESKQEES